MFQRMGKSIGIFHPLEKAIEEVLTAIEQQRNEAGDGFSCGAAHDSSPR
jgi:hypothetical protein